MSPEETELSIRFYDARWPEMFQYLRRRLDRHLDDLPLTIEHVGGTAVPGCVAKPIIDIDIVLPGAEPLPEVIGRLTGYCGYRHEGDLGVRGREAFTKKSPVPHHLYTVIADTKPHLDHIAFRDHLRRHPDEVARYGELKLSLVRELGISAAARAAYPAAKSGFVEEVLSRVRAG